VSQHTPDVVSLQPKNGRSIIVSRLIIESARLMRPPAPKRRRIVENGARAAWLRPVSTKPKLSGATSSLSIRHRSGRLFLGVVKEDTRRKSASRSVRRWLAILERRPRPPRDETTTLSEKSTPYAFGTLHTTTSVPAACADRGVERAGRSSVPTASDGEDACDGAKVLFARVSVTAVAELA